MKYDKSKGFWKSENFWKIAAIASVAISIPIAGIQHGTESQREWGKLGAFGFLTGIAATYACTQKHLPNEWEEEIRKRLHLLEEEEARLKSELTEIEFAQHQLEEEQNLINSKWESIKQAESNIDDIISERLQLATVGEVKRLQDWENTLIKEQSKFDVNTQKTVDIINEELREKEQQLIEEKAQLEEKHQKIVEVYKQKVAEQSELIHLLDAPKFPTKREIMAEVYCSDFIKACLRWEKRIKADCYDRQPMDDGKSHNFWLKLRDNSLAVELKREEFRDWVSLQCKFPTRPYIIFHPSEGTVEIQIPHNLRDYKAPKEYQIVTTTTEVKGTILKPPSVLCDSLSKQIHLAGWGSTGEGKSTFIANALGAMSKDMGDGVRIVTTIPKMDTGIAKLFPSIDYLGFRDSIYGLLEVATELGYRNSVFIDEYLSGNELEEWEPLIYFFDEYNQIAAKWNSCAKETFDDVIQTFKTRLDPARLEVFKKEIEIDIKHTRFANELLLFAWRVGRSMNVKMFIFGQNLQPSNLGVKKPDLHNTSWLFMPKNIGSAFVYKATETDKSSLESEHQKIREVVQADRNLRFYGLYFPVEGDAFYSQLPAPNTYAIPRDTSRTPGEHPESSHEDTADLGKMAKNAKQAKPYSVSVRPCFDEMAKINSECLKQSQKLDIEDFGELPKSMTTGKVKKTEVYKLLKVKSAKHQKLVKEYIDYMDKEYNT